MSQLLTNVAMSVHIAYPQHTSLYVVPASLVRFVSSCFPLLAGACDPVAALGSILISLRLRIERSKRPALLDLNI